MKKNTFTLAELAAQTGAQLIGDATYCIRNVADLDTATEEDISFLANPRYEQAMLKSNAGAVFISHNTPRVPHKNYLIHENPSAAFQKAIEFFHGKDVELSHFTGIHPSAIIHDTCTIAKGVTIGPYVVIDKETVIGEGSFIGSGCYIGPYTTIGTNCVLHPHVTVRENCTLGNRVILQPGVVIGSCGFGYIPDRQGRHIKLDQRGTVQIEDDVEIGANSTIDRARFKSTRICRGTKIDNLVQIAHGVVIGEDNILVAQTGIAGSSQTGKHVVIGGQVAIAGHLKLEDGVMLAGRTGVTKSLPKGKYGGIPAMPLQEHNRNGVYLRNIETYVNHIKDLEKRLQKLEMQE